MRKFIIFVFAFIIVLLVADECRSQSVYFDGNDYASEVLGAVFRASDDKGTIIIIGKWETLNDGVLWSVGQSNSSSNWALIASLDVGGSDYIYFVIDEPTTYGVRGSTILQTDTWYHIIVMSSGSSWKIYINGNLETLTVTAGANNGRWFNDLDAGLNVFDFGVLHRSTLSGYLTGYIDEMAVFSDTLTTAQVATYYNGGCQYDLTGQANLVFYARCNEGTGTTITDAVGGLVLDFQAAAADPSWNLTQYFPVSAAGYEKRFKRFDDYKKYKR